jgi:hypothetical protein
VVEEVVYKLNNMVRNATFAFAMSVGKLIITTFYGGCPTAWRERGVKDYSFRRLARHPQLRMSSTTLYRSVAIYELCQRIGIEQWHHVSMSHVRLVLPLPTEEQSLLLKSAEMNQWPTRRLQEEIAAWAKRGHEQSTRKRRSRLKATIQIIERCLDDANQFVGMDESTCEPSPDSVRRARVLIERLNHACLVLERHLPGANGEDLPPPFDVGDDSIQNSHTSSDEYNGRGVVAARQRPCTTAIVRSAFEVSRPCLHVDDGLFSAEQAPQASA